MGASWLRIGAGLLVLSCTALTLGAGTPMTPLEQLLTSGVAQGKNGWLFHVAEFGRYRAETPQDSGDKLEVIAGISAAFKQQNVQLILALVPAKLHLYEAQLPPELPLTDAIRNRYTQSLEKLRANGVATVDLLTPMRAAQASPDEARYPVYQRLDHHFSSRGALVAGKAVSDYIRAHVSLAGLPKASFELVAQPPDVYRESSLLSRLPKAEQSKYAPEAYIPYTLERRSASAGLLGGPEPLVALVGSSASKGGALWPFEYALPAGLSTEVVNAAQVGRGPWLPLEEYLRDPSYQRTRPRIVIWQLWEAFLLDVDQAGLPEDWPLTLGGLIPDGCAATTRLESTPSASGQQINLPAGGAGSDNLVLEVSSPRLERVTVEVAGRASKNTVTVRLGLPNERYRLKVPLALTGESAERVTVQMDAKQLTVHSALRCAIPASLARLLMPSPGTHSMIGPTDRLTLNGFGDAEAAGVRWAVGMQSSIDFWSEGQPLEINVGVYNPIAGQRIAWTLNGQPLEVWADLKAEQQLERTWRLTPLRGRNRLAMTVKAFNGAGSDFASGDARALSVMFNRFDLTF
jgi:alginate O-acetyltransferase complex protein AlgJ